MASRSQRRRRNPQGTHGKTRELTREFGPKPAWMKWRTYHHLAEKNPDKLRATLAAYSTRAAVLT